MNASLFSTKDMIKYLIVAGLIYSILKMIPSQKIANKDLVLILAVITIGFVSVDYLFFKKSETFVNSEKDLLDLNVDVDTLIKTRAEELEKIISPKFGSEIKPEPPGINTELPKVELPKVELPSVTTDKISCGMEIDKVKKQLQTEIDTLKNQVRTSQLNDKNEKIVNKYFDSLLAELSSKGLLSSVDIENIKLKRASNLLTLEEIISSLETLKKDAKANSTKVDGVVKNDFVYNELPSDFFNPIGDKIANEWANDYTILNTDKWRVPMPTPPVCVNTTPCKVCPSDSTGNALPLKNWDDARMITANKINQSWAKDQQ